MNLSAAPLLGRFLALTTNNRLSWKGLPGTNTQAYYENSYLAAVKSLSEMIYFVNSVNILI
jgi:hypothetical protein